jgi:hypothetical protein
MNEYMWLWAVVGLLIAAGSLTTVQMARLRRRLDETDAAVRRLEEAERER